MKVWNFAVALVLAATGASGVQAATIQTADAVNLPGTIFNTNPTSTTGTVAYRIGWTASQWRSPFQNNNESKINPYHDTQQYLSIQGGASATWAGAGNAISLFWGSPDSYNTIEFLDSNGTVFDSLTGNAVVPPGTFAVGHVLTTILANGFFSSVRLKSGSNAFELTNFEISCTTCAPALDTPVPGALPLFASGLGLLGFCGWRRRRKSA